MPSFPGSVKSFTSKQDGAGNTINAAHINDLQDEVSAIETALLNGTAPLASSGFNIKGEIKLNGSSGTSTGQVLTYKGGSSFVWQSAAGSNPILAKSTNYTVSSTDPNGVFIEFTGTGLSTITLFAPTASSGRTVLVKNASANSTSIVTVAVASTFLIDSTLTFALNFEDAATFKVNAAATKWLVY